MSGCAGQVKRGLEISGIAAVDLDYKVALHLTAFQTLLRQEGQTLLDFYANGIIERKAQLQQISNKLVADAYFSKAPFVDKLKGAGFELISRLRNDARMRYLYEGERSVAPGRPRKFDGHVDLRQLRQSVFTKCGEDTEGNWIAFTAVVNIPSWKRSARVVIIHQLDAKKEIVSHRIL